MNIKSFGENPSGERLKRIENSLHYRDGKFRNVKPTSVNPGNVSIFRIIKKMLSRPDSVRPSVEVPSIKTDLKRLEGEEPVVIWFGHSSYFMKINGTTILVDPVFSGNASPFSFFGKAFPGSDRYEVQDMPEIDLLILTHDHYDHLDWPTIRELAPKVDRIVTSLGVGAHLEYWGVEAAKIIELDWWQQKAISEGISLTATPSRHFSGRGFKRAQTLWSSFVLEIGRYKIFIGSDSGYDTSFKQIGKTKGPFDLAFLECGQYGEYWPEIHMFPEQTAKAAIEIGAALTVPVHWGKFVLSVHSWNEPVKRFVKAAQKEDVNYAIPRIGEPLYFKREYRQDNWWEFE